VQIVKLALYIMVQVGLKILMTCPM